MRLRDMAGARYATAPTEATLGQVALLLARGAEVVVLTDGQGTPMGTVTKGDVVRAVARGLGPDAPAAEAMTSPVASMGPDDDPLTAARTMKALGVRHLALVDRGRLVGVVSLEDLVDPWSILEEAASAPTAEPPAD